MRIEEIKTIVNHEGSKVYNAKLSDGTTKKVRLWYSPYFGAVCILNKRSRTKGHLLENWYDHYEDWVSLSLVESKDIDYHKRFCNRAKKALELLSESGLLTDLKDTIIRFFNLSESEQKEFVNDILKDSYEFWKMCHAIEGEDGKYSWASCAEILIMFTKKNCWKSINLHKRDRKYITDKVEDAIKNGKDYSYRWRNGYDNTIDVWIDREGGKHATYSEEYVNCGNGHYYLMLDATHAIHYEDD